MPSGTFVSSVKDAKPAAGTTPTWTTLSFDATTPANTAVAFQVAASNSVAGPFTFVGPRDADTFFTTSGADLSQFDGFWYLKYEALLSSTDTSTTIDPVRSGLLRRQGRDIARGGFGVRYRRRHRRPLGGADRRRHRHVGEDNRLHPQRHQRRQRSYGIGRHGDASERGADRISPGNYPAGVAASFVGDTDDEPSSGSNSLTVIGVPTGVRR